MWPTSGVSDITGPAGPSERAEHGRDRPGRRKAVLHGIFAVVGLVAMALLVRSVGPSALVTALRSSARWLPLLFALELGRVATEIWATRSLSAAVRARVPFVELTRAHVLGYAIASVMPAGRAAGEALKAAMLSRFVGAPEAAAVGAANQSSAMLGGALAAIPCVIAAYSLTGTSALTGSLAVFTVVSLFIVAAFQIACRRRDVGGALIRKITKMEESSTSFEAAIGRIPPVPLVATIAALASRALFTIELVVLLHATAGVMGFGRTWLTLGVSLVGGAIGDMVPGQLGASDGAFALAAGTLGITAADGVAIAMTQHVVQLAWGALGFALPFVWRSSRDPRAAAGGVPVEG
jgi:hypothetical protein